MDPKQLVDTLKQLQKTNTEESNKKIIELVDNYLPTLSGINLSALKNGTSISTVVGLAKEVKTATENKEIEMILMAFRERANCTLLEMELEKVSETDKKKMIHLQGKLIKAYEKYEKYETVQNNLYAARYRKVQLLENQKSAMKDYRQTADNIGIFEKVSLKIKEVSNVVKAFLEKKDIILKIKNIFKESAMGGISSFVLIAGISLAIQMATGLPTFNLATLAGVMPVTAYSALTSLIRNISTKTGFQQYQYFQSEEFKEFIEKFKVENKDLLLLLQNLQTEKANCNSNEEKIKINEEIIKVIDELNSHIDIKAVRDSYALQALSCFRENKIYCKEVVDAYLDEKNNNKEKYKQYNEKLGKINMQIFLRENSLKEAVLSAGKGVVKNTAIMVLAKAIVTAIVPESTIAIHGINSFILPVAMALTNGLIEIPTYNGKLKYKETSDNKKINVKEKEKIEKLFGNFKLQYA